MTRQKILEDISVERDRQIAKWSGKFDDAQWLPGDWHEMIADYNAWARRMGSMGSPDKQRRRLIQVAALAVAAIEVIDAKAEDKRFWCTGNCQHAYQEMLYDHVSCQIRVLHGRWCERPGGPVPKTPA
jgi:hypothetical protein